ncbi:MAG: hypothetical protein GC199_02930 [Alphaproteobacteria bacterium]|nr:hypothetical protein [Alphaproteobacteria bacterium]
MSANPYEEGPFRQVSDMEKPLATIHDLLAGIAFIAETLGDEEGSAIQRIAWLGIRECKAAEELRGDLFRLTHPRREHFEKEGWPT